jgi:NADH-quinone oxidoreductase subunit L
MADLANHPGLIYVAATLLPLLSFFILFITGGVRRWYGWTRPSRYGAYFATGAIALSCVLSLVGFVWHAQSVHHDEERIQALEAEKHKAEELLEGLDPKNDVGKIDSIRRRMVDNEHKIEELEGKWRDRVAWVGLSGDIGDRPGSVLQLGYRIDTLAASMFLMVSFIATLIHLFSIGYMNEELQDVVEDHQVHTPEGHLRRKGRFGQFFMFLSLFCFSMLNLVLADNLFQVFISWELVGICSYLLIGFYYERKSASNAANKAFITNRVGDAGFIIGLLILWTYVGTLNFEDLFRQVRCPVEDSHEHLALAGQIVRADWDTTKSKPRLVVTERGRGGEVVLFPRRPVLDHDAPGHFHGVEVGSTVPVKVNPTDTQYGHMPYWLLVVAGLGIFLGCVGKSAQFPLHVWLPDAMEGPTPVSALIHAATMVAAGVYLVGRCFPLFPHETRLVIAYTGGITLFVAATIAIVMTDIKKVLAYSTVSQLGYMMLALGVGGWVAGLFHLFTHAFFKALLFLGSGSVIYGCHHEQEMTKMGGLYPKMKVTALTMLFAVFAIAGTPLFSGWYSKDAILAQAFGFMIVHPEHSLLFLLPLLTAGITTFYMFRMWFMTFTGRPRDAHVYEHAHESPTVMLLPLVILAFFSVVVAWGWPVWDAKASWLEQHLHHSQHHAILADYGWVPELGESAPGVPDRAYNTTERHWAEAGHELAGGMALGMAFLAFLFAAAVYYYRWLDPAEAKGQVEWLHRFLSHKWYFDELYSAVLVRPALVVAGWARAFDTHVIDGFVNWLGRFTVHASKWEGWFDLGIIDGLANLTARVAYDVGGWFRSFQTGYLRSYVLFLVLAAVGLFALLSLFLAMATAG